MADRADFLISADSHVAIPVDAWQVYLDPAFRDEAPRYEVDDEGIFRVFEGRRRAIGASEMLVPMPTSGPRITMGPPTISWRQSGPSDRPPPIRIVESRIRKSTEWWRKSSTTAAR